MHKTISLRLIPALIAITFSGGAFAAAFQLTGQSASGVGIANAGAAAAAEDTSTLYYNPAGMTYLSEGHNISIAATVLDRSTRFTNEGSSRLGGFIRLVEMVGMGAVRTSYRPCITLIP